MSAAASAWSMPTWTAPRLPPPERTNAVRAGAGLRSAGSGVITPSMPHGPEAAAVRPVEVLANVAPDVHPGESPVTW